MHVGQAAVDAVGAERESLMVDSQQMQDGGVDVVYLRGIFTVERLVAPLIAWAVRDAALDAAAGEPICEHKWIVIPAEAALRRGHAAELGGPEDDGVFQH